MRVRAVGVLALMALVLASCGGATPEAAGPTEGIQVHGDWTIDVYNPDGSLDEHHEFSNALGLRGGAQLINLLAGGLTTGGLWEIELSPGCPSSTGGTCSMPGIVAIGVDEDANGVFDLLRLVGETTVEADAAIDRVVTNIGFCSSSVSPDACTNGENNNPFTARDFAAADTVPVSAGQTVQVQVDISFTTG